MAADSRIGRSNAPTARKQKPATTEAQPELEKDETELRLEKVLFGDDAGFLESLKAPRDSGKSLRRLSHGSGSVDSAEEEDAEEYDLEDVPDEDLFFLDAGTGEPPTSLNDDSLKYVKSKRSQAVWYDSDDDRLTVSLASNNRLRKLRDTEDDDVVTGREYIQRLRRQYERLHPTPEWVTYARKKRKISNGDQHSGSDSDSDVSMDDTGSATSVQPLADLLRTAGSLTRNDSSTDASKRKLRSEVIDIHRLKDIATSGPSSVDALQFHPYYPLLLTAGPSQTVSLYHVSPQPPNPHPLLTSLHLRNTPLHTASFCTPSPSKTSSIESDQTRIFLSSRRRYFHIWSLSSGTVQKVTRPLQTFKSAQKTTEHFKISPCGRFIGLVSSARKDGGTVNVLSTSTLQWECSCRVDSDNGITDFDWWSDGNGFAVIGKSGEVSEYNVIERRVVARWHDDGGVGTTVLSIGGPDSRWMAIGSSSGIVNVYDRHAPDFASIFQANASNESSSGSKPKGTITAHPKPKRVLDQLTTPISHLVFSNDGQILIMASRWKRNALRIVHLASCTVYRNWPTEKTPLGRVASVAVSRDGEYIAVGNENGKVGLWEIRG